MNISKYLEQLACKTLSHIFLVTFALVIFFWSQASSSDISQCFMIEEDAYWSNLKNRTDIEYEKIALAEYRHTLCKQVAKGQLTEQEAENLFNYERALVMDILSK